jgi:hypothetical protein
MLAFVYLNESFLLLNHSEILELLADRFSPKLFIIGFRTFPVIGRFLAMS